MCHNQVQKNFSLSVSKLTKVAFVLVFFCFAECAAGSCLSYGHSCWGAHGKRDGGRGRLYPFKGETDSKLLAKLLQMASPLDFKHQPRHVNEILPGNQASTLDLNDLNGPIKSYSDSQENEMQDTIGQDVFSEVFGTEQKPSEKLRILDFLRKNAGRMN